MGLPVGSIVPATQRKINDDYVGLMTYEQPDKTPDQLAVEAHVKAEKDADRQAAMAAEEAIRLRAREAAKREVEQTARRVVLERGSSVPVVRTRWLWRTRIPLGGLALIAGKGDVSKSTLFAQMVAWLTTGDMKGEFYGEPRNVLYVVNEDSVSQTVVPRMIAHGADMDRVFFVKVDNPLWADALSLPRDSDLLTDAILSSGAVATFVDPLSANVTGRANDSRDTRATYQEVNRIAEFTDSAIVGLAHTRKAGAADIIEAILGSSEQGNVARSVHGLVMDDDEDGARILSCEKLNVGNKSDLASLRFVVVSHNVPCSNGEWTTAPRIEWIEETDDTASDMLADQLNGHSGVDECARFIKHYVMSNGGEVLASDALATPDLKKCSKMMIQRARKKAGILSKRQTRTQAGCIWYFPIYTRGE